MNQFHLSYLTPVMEKEIKKGVLHSSALRVIHKGNIVYDTELGYVDKENQKPTAKDTIYRLFSMTKPITAVACMILNERGLLHLMDPVSDYLEGFKNQKIWTKEGLVPVEKEMTIWNLLNMTSGLPYADPSFESGIQMSNLFQALEQEQLQGKKVCTIEVANRMGQIPLEYEPGTCWRYGVSADILGAVIEAVTKKTLGEFLKEELFIPLGMKDTGFYVPEDKWHRFAQVYEYREEIEELVPFTRRVFGLEEYKSEPSFQSGGAGLVSTMDDYTKFTMMLLGEGELGGKRILGRKTIEYLRTPSLHNDIGYSEWESMPGYDYGNFMRILTDPIKCGSNGNAGEYGWDGWTGNHFFIDPKEELIFIYMVQKCGARTTSMLRRLRSIIYSSI